MAQLKTQKTEASVENFLNGILNEQTRKDCFEIARMMKQATGEEPAMWGTSIIGFGSIHLTYASGRELDWMIVGFSPRKQNITLYLPGNLASHAALLERLGKHKAGVGCVYIKSLQDVDTGALAELIHQSVQAINIQGTR
jgi:hypothetical protein